MSVSYKDEYTPEQKQRLLGIARQALTDHLSNRQPTNPTIDPQQDKYLIVPRGVFVTLRDRDGRLRGCIGTFEQTEPLYRTVVRMSVAVTHDPRFVYTQPVVLAELNDLRIGLSILTPMRRVTDPTTMQIGVDGLCIRDPNPNTHNGVFLPEVAEENRWTVEQTLNNCCSQKMNLPEDAWRTRDDLEFYFFGSHKIAEPD
ncbi:AmmeMemoRadiSam system protein A [Planctomycetales bacterium ZRK34]|nr:AmmeMemoRadiSam system protein A [Planctomycetales bacterium ZRK34]